ncbi:acetylglutamate kinase [Rhodomicrobium lacus]|jgi:acetylglutamate kinase|uniref:acetylglutamate kinase n=1 Tax=Rhodomicrobium TaxID=1068 RepID=UPI0015F2E345
MSATEPDPNEEFYRGLRKPSIAAEILSEALPYMQRYDQATVVIKYGGHAMGDAKLAESFARDIVMLEQASVKPVVVHGGGPQIAKLLARLDIKSEFSGGLRVTDAATVEVVEMVLAGSINKGIVAEINALGGHACGISGKDGNLMIAKKLTRTEIDPDSAIERVVDLGFVGDPEEVNPRIVEVLAQNEIIPVVAPLGLARDGTTYNINADTFASALAGALKAKRLLLLTDVAGVLDKNKKLIHRLTVSQARAMIADGTISGGMIPKVEGCINVIKQGVEGVVILDGRVPHAVLLELFTEHGVGTLIERD